MRIGISQINTQAGDLAHTADRMAGISQVAAERGVDLLVFPVAALTGPTPVDYSNQGAFLSDVAEGLTDLATRVDCACLVPVVIPVGDGVSVEVAHLHDGIMTPIRYGKQVRSPFSTNTEDDGALATLEIAGSVLGLAFSYEDLDQWRDSSQSVDVICYLAGYGYAVDDVSSVLGAALDDGRYQQDALETGAWFVGVASLGGYGAQVFSGSSFVLAPDGQLVASSPAFEEDLLVADVGQGAAKEGARNITPEVYDDRYHLWQALVLGIHDYVHKLGRSDVALALDGTLSSMLLAVLATDALGPTHVHALLAAGGAARVADVSRLAQALRIDARPTTLAAADGLMARDLMQVELAALARELDALALSSLDKTALALEPSIGTACASELAPLGDVYRIDVLDVARFRNTISPVFPSLEVRPEDLPDVGIPIPSWGCERLLERIDSVLAAHVEGECDLNTIIAMNNDEEVAAVVLQALRDREALRAPYPSCLVMTTRTLMECRMPAGFAWRDSVRPEGVRTNEAFEALLGQDVDTPTDVSPIASRLTTEGIEQHRSELLEAFELLRDLAVGPGGEWPGPFSEN